MRIVSKQVTTSTPVEPRPAATVVLVRDGARGLEVLLLKRHHAMAFLAGAHVFPGGRVEASDRDMPAEQLSGRDRAAAQLPELDPDEAVAWHVAAIRELFEEAGLLLARDTRGECLTTENKDERRRLDDHRAALAHEPFSALLARERLRLALDALALFAHWVTPAGEARRFDTRFFLARVPPRQGEGDVDRESVGLAWWTPADAIRRCQAGDVVLPPPTWTTLRELERVHTADEAFAWALGVRPVVRREPHFVDADGAREIVVPDTRFESRFQLVEGRWRAIDSPGGR
jgi:8-oxo-dGTP pyrophosphatase MutT (NUDIX family)